MCVTYDNDAILAFAEGRLLNISRDSLTVIGRHEEARELTDEECFTAMLDADESITMPPKSRRSVTLSVKNRRKGGRHEEAV